MRRLIRKSRLKKIAFGGTFYHATLMSNLEKITSDGMIRANEGEGLGPVGMNSKFDTYDGYVFLSDQFNFGASIVANFKGVDPNNPICVLELDLDSNAVHQDPEFNDSHSFVIRGDVSANYIKKVTILNEENKPVVEANLNDWKEKYEEYLKTGEAHAGKNGEVIKKIESYGGEYWPPEVGEDYEGSGFSYAKISDIVQLTSATTLYSAVEGDSIFMRDDDFPEGDWYFIYNVSSNTIEADFDKEEMNEHMEEAKDGFEHTFDNQLSSLKFVLSDGSFTWNDFNA